MIHPLNSSADTFQNLPSVRDFIGSTYNSRCISRLHTLTLGIRARVAQGITDSKSAFKVKYSGLSNNHAGCNKHAGLQILKNN